jgi:hypothetical protein
MATKQAKPNLASQAPNESITNANIISEVLTNMANEAIIRVRDKIIPSRARRAINKCLR